MKVPPGGFPPPISSCHLEFDSTNGKSPRRGSLLGERERGVAVGSEWGAKRGLGGPGVAVNADRGSPTGTNTSGGRWKRGEAKGNPSPDLGVRDPPGGTREGRGSRERE